MRKTTNHRRTCLRVPGLFVLAISFAAVLVFQLTLNLSVTRSPGPLLSSFPSDPMNTAFVPVPGHSTLGNATKRTISPLDEYDPLRFPVFSKMDETSIPLKVGIVTISPLIGEARHFLYEGVFGSNVLELVCIVSLYGTHNDTTVAVPIADSWNPRDADVWIVDGARVAKLQRPFLEKLIKAKKPSWKVLFVDFTDRFQFQLRKYQHLNIWNKRHIRLAARSIVQGRHYDEETGSIIKGSVAPNLRTAGGPMLHAPYAVRADTIEMLQNLVSYASTTDASLAIDLFDAPSERFMDVVHMWDVSFKEGKSKLRYDVSEVVRNWNGTLQVGDRYLKTSNKEEGERRQVGRNTVDRGYIKALLASKIVVVTQKDDWEDHYRLFESMVCGGLVMHDSMVAPPKGVVHEESIIFFDNVAELEKSVLYYMEHDEERELIARKGLEVAMNRHRSWHRMEELLFGRPLTIAA